MSSNAPFFSTPTYVVDVNLADPVEVVRSLRKRNPTERPNLLIDCQQLRCLRTRGVSFLVSQLLLARAAGAELLLYNVGPTLLRVLQLLQLQQLFRIWPATTKANS
ncbi:STAS domain-containing protein [Hymenobacter puniceus]|uniref:STAS domain-containing protein n=1 Tax=Hymenobacter sp. BT190 TaxID=2763505 RepID=UPI001651948B|nr:STAS domain-containing protein [Hymenobacter sp. BT190]MBC6698544.1 STAS domain-containing protein [Hymenobacter sp. BT190]